MAHEQNRAQREGYMAELTQANCIVTMANVLMTGRTNAEYTADGLDVLTAAVESVAQEFGATPEDVQRALEYHEPELAIKWE